MPIPTTVRWIPNRNQESHSGNGAGQTINLEQIEQGRHVDVELDIRHENGNGILIYLLDAQFHSAKALYILPNADHLINVEGDWCGNAHVSFPLGRCLLDQWQ